MSEIDASASPVTVSPIVYPNRIRRIRELLNLSMSDLAERTSTSVAHLSYMERGRRRPSAEKVGQIADVLNVSDDRLEVLPEHTEEYEKWMSLRDDARREIEESVLFGHRLRQVRKDRGLSIRQICEGESGLMPWQVRNFEVYGSEPNEIEMKALAFAMGFRSVPELEAAIDALSSNGEAGSAGAASRRRSRQRALEGETSPFLSGDGEDHDAKLPRGAVSLDGDQLADKEWLLKGAILRILREPHILDGMAYVVMSGKKPVGVGRARNGEVRCGSPGHALIGVPWRIVSIAYPDRLF